MSPPLSLSSPRLRLYLGNASRNASESLADLRQCHRLLFRPRGSSHLLVRAARLVSVKTISGTVRQICGTAGKPSAESAGAWISSLRFTLALPSLHPRLSAFALSVGYRGCRVKGACLRPLAPPSPCPSSSIRLRLFPHSRTLGRLSLAEHPQRILPYSSTSRLGYRHSSRRSTPKVRSPARRAAASAWIRGPVATKRMARGRAGRDTAATRRSRRQGFGGSRTWSGSCPLRPLFTPTSS